jgi:hypothetical protein
VLGRVFAPVSVALRKITDQVRESTSSRSIFVDRSTAVRTATATATATREISARLQQIFTSSRSTFVNPVSASIKATTTPSIAIRAFSPSVARTPPSTTQKSTRGELARPIDTAVKSVSTSFTAVHAFSPSVARATVPTASLVTPSTRVDTRVKPSVASTPEVTNLVKVLSPVTVALRGVNTRLRESTTSRSISVDRSAASRMVTATREIGAQLQKVSTSASTRSDRSRTLERILPSVRASTPPAVIARSFIPSREQSDRAGLLRTAPLPGLRDPHSARTGLQPLSGLEPLTRALDRSTRLNRGLGDRAQRTITSPSPSVITRNVEVRWNQYGAINNGSDEQALLRKVDATIRSALR